MQTQREDTTFQVGVKNTKLIGFRFLQTGRLRRPRQRPLEIVNPKGEFSAGPAYSNPW